MTFERFMKAFLRFMLKPLSFVPALLVMYMIYNFSAQTAQVSSKASSKVTQYIVITMDRGLDLELDAVQTAHAIAKLEHYVRKLAHFSEYALLALTIALPLYVYRLRGFPLVIVAELICFLYAVSDEYHQFFVAGRAASWKDVAIDSCGSLFGIYFTRIIGFIGRKTFFRKLQK